MTIVVTSKKPGQKTIVYNDVWYIEGDPQDRDVMLVRLMSNEWLRINLVEYIVSVTVDA